MKQENLLRAIKISMPIMFPLMEVAFRIPYLNRVFKF